MLPERSAAAEDAFVASWAASDDLEGLLEAIEEAVTERRPTLAARLVGLVGDQVEIEPGGVVDQARQAARMLVVQGRAAAPELLAAFEEAWSRARKEKMRRIKDRVRDMVRGELSVQRRFGRKNRRR